MKPLLKEITKPVNLVLNSDIRAVERAEFDQQVYPVNLEKSTFHLS